MKLIEQGQLLQGRDVLSVLLFDPTSALSNGEAQTVRATLASINKDLVFSSKVTANDPLTETYTIAQGDYLSRVAPRFGVTYQFLETINGIDSRRLRLGQKIKVMHGPFHAVIVKSQFRMDVYANAPDGKPIYIRSFAIGLGTDDSTPPGAWRLASGGKVVKPTWTNPRTGEFFEADNPKNPLGGYWMRLQGADESTKGLSGYGIHGTIEQESIGKQMSMGCIRIGAGDIELAYKMLVDGRSMVTIK